MDRKLFHRRVFGLVLLIALAIFGLGCAMYDAQMVRGAEFAALSQRKIASTETVEAARGEILDRYGRVLVSNRVVYQVSLNTSQMKDRRNEIIEALLDIARQEGVSWNDSLPITAYPPFAFTTTAYYTQGTDEAGKPVYTLTRLGRLAVKLKWSSDPTAPGAQDTPLPGAEELLDRMCYTFGLAARTGSEQEGYIYDYAPRTKTQAREIAGVLYELYLRSQDIFWTPYLFAQEVDIRFISKVKEGGLSGVEIQPTTVRQYHTDYAAHLLGRVALMNGDEWAYYKELGYDMDETVGKEGAERAFESYLRGQSGVRSVERNTEGKVVGETWQSEPQPGDNIVLTIDLDLQMKVEDALAAGLPKLASKEVQGAACVVMDVKGGDILAAASYPTFLLAGYSANYDRNVADPLKPLFNRAVQGAYPPGSTFKMVTAVAALEEGIVTPATRIRDEGVYRYYTQNGPMCWIYRQYRGTHGLQNISQAITNSCNYYFYDVGRQLGIGRIGQYARLFGLGEKTGIELPENIGVMAGPVYTESVGGTWYDGNTLSVAIGQENSQFTPLQLANYIATLANGGTHYSAHLLKEVKSSDFAQVLYTRQPEVLDTIEIDPKNLEAVKKGMLDLTTSGSVASYFRGLGVAVGAKTGSAQVSVNTESNAVFVCFAPYDDPQVALALVVERGGGGTDLGAIAADILAYYFSAQETREEIVPENALTR